MTVNEEIGRAIKKIIDREIESQGFNPQDFYRDHTLGLKIWRLRNGKSFSSSGIRGMLNLISNWESDLDVAG